MSFVVAGAVAALPVAARADRALAPTETLDGGNLEVGARLGTERTSRAVDGEDTRMRARDSLAAGELSLRAWLADGFWLGLSQTGFFAHSAHQDGTAIEVDGTGLTALTGSTGAVFRAGRFDIGGSLSLAIPNTDDFDLRQFDATARAIGGYQLSSIGGQAFVVAEYLLRHGDEAADSTDRMSATLGYQRRVGALSLVPAGAVERAVSSSVEEDAAWSLRGSLLVGYELLPNLTCTALAEGTAELAHRLGFDGETSGRELAVELGVIYAWDTEQLAGSGQSPPDPAAIAVIDVEGSAVVARALRAQIPALRRNTLDAERRAGGADGTMRVTLTLRPDGRVESADVVDAIGAPELVEAVERYFRHLVLRSNVARVAFTLVFEQS